MKKFVTFFITCYQLLSPLRGHCRFYPTCSQYAKEAIETYGIIHGLVRAGARVLRCNPFVSPRIDFVTKGGRR